MELIFDFKKFYININSMKKIGLGVTIGNDGFLVVFLCFYFGIIPKHNIF